MTELSPSNSDLFTKYYNKMTLREKLIPKFLRNMYIIDIGLKTIKRYGGNYLQ